MTAFSVSPLVTPQLVLATALAGMVWFDGAAAPAAKYDGKLTVRVLDEQTRQPLAARMELQNQRGRPVRLRPEGAVVVDDYFAFEGEITLELRKGNYQFLIEAGPEYQTRPGHFTLDRHAEDTSEVLLNRRVNMQAEGWWAGDLDVWQRFQDLPQLMRAAKVDFVPSLLEQNLRGKCQSRSKPKNTQDDVYAFLDRRRGGGLLYYSDEQIEGICAAKADGSSLELLEVNHGAELTTVGLTPFAWDLPLWTASGKLDAVQILHRHALVDDVVDNESWGRKRDKTFFPGKTGNGRWSETIYHHLLNCGLKLPPAAGSGSGSNKNPVGTNRTYVYCDQEFSPDRWLAGLKAGNVMVTNGPLLRTTVEGEVPGVTFSLATGEVRTFQIGLNLAFYEQAPVEYLEIIKDGLVAHEVRLAELASNAGRLPPLEFDGSGWFLVRAMTNKTSNYQFATTGPYYVEADAQPRISRTSVQFFLDWLEEAANEFADNEKVREEIQAARPFWQDLMSRANAE